MVTSVYDIQAVSSKHARTRKYHLVDHSTGATYCGKIFRHPKWHQVKSNHRWLCMDCLKKQAERAVRSAG